MAFTRERFVELRPYLYHFTSNNNLRRIRSKTRLEIATSLLMTAGCQSQVALQRLGPKLIHPDEVVQLQTQKPFVAANALFSVNWDAPRFIKSLNDLVFFWPGDESKPIAYGRRHLAGNDWGETTSTAIRIPTADLFGQQLALFCLYNSGAPRCSGGKKSPRGPETFLPCTAFLKNAGDVKEVVFEGPVSLPSSAEYCDALGGDRRWSWSPLSA